MILISHRGNISGPNPEKENHPDYIEAALRKGYNVEIDVWQIDKNLVLGHDEPLYEVDFKFLINQLLWCHAKNISALHTMLSCEAHCFWHEKDKTTFTSKGFMWTYPGEQLTNMSICVMPEISNYTNNEISQCFGICTDYINFYKKNVIIK